MKFSWKNLFKSKSKEEIIPNSNLSDLAENDSSNSFLDMYSKILTKYNILPNGNNFYEEGYSFQSKENAENHVNNKLKPIFLNISKEFDLQLIENQASISNRLELIETDINFCQNKLKENEENSFLYQINQKIKKLEDLEKELENSAFPEKRLNKAIGEIFIQFEANIKEVINLKNQDVETLSTVLKQKKLFDFTKQHFKSLKTLNDSILFKIHSTFYPPKPEYFKTFYTFCVLLLIAEAGFSMSIIKTIMETGYGVTIDRIMSLFYSIGISLSMAAAFKVLIENLLFKIWFKGIIFWSIVLVVFYLLLILFSYDDTIFITRKNFYQFSNKAIILSFFSCTFALANAFIFREASYLHHLHTKLEKYGDLKSLNDERTIFINSWNNNLQSLIKKKENLVLQQQKIESENINNIKDMISNLQEISITSFWKGIDKRGFDIIYNNQEIINIVKNLLEKQKIL